MNAEAQAVAQVERSLTLLMRQAARPSAWRRLAVSAQVDLDRIEYTTLARIEETGGQRGARLTDLAEVMGLDISTLSRQVRRLEQVGLVLREADPADQRAHRLHLTPAGCQMLSRARRAREEAMAELLRDWSGAEVGELARLLGRLVGDLAAQLAAEAAPGCRAEAVATERGGNPT